MNDHINSIMTIHIYIDTNTTNLLIVVVVVVVVVIINIILLLLVLLLLLLLGCRCSRGARARPPSRPRGTR